MHAAQMSSFVEGPWNSLNPPQFAVPISAETDFNQTTHTEDGSYSTDSQCVKFDDVTRTERTTIRRYTRAADYKNTDSFVSKII